MWNRVSKTPDGRIVSKFFCKKAKSLLSLIVIKKGNFLLITLFGIKNIAEWFKTAKHKCARCPIQHFFQLTYWGIDILRLLYSVSPLSHYRSLILNPWARHYHWLRTESQSAIFFTWEPGIVAEFLGSYGLLNSSDEENSALTWDKKIRHWSQ